MRISNYGLHGLHPPFICPWALEGCKQISHTKEEHVKHIWNVHELPGERSRGIRRRVNPHVKGISLRRKHAKPAR